MDDLPRIAVVSAVIAASWALLGRRLVDLRRRPGDAGLRAVCLALAGVAVAMTAQFAGVWLDGVTGTPNTGRFAGNCAAMLAVCGGRLLLDHVTGDPRPAARHIAVLALAVASAAVLFAVTPPQAAAVLGVRTRATHTVYSSPYVYVYLAYLAYALHGGVGSAWRSAGLTVRRPLRYGLRILAVSGACGLAYCAVKGALLTAYEVGLDVAELEYAVVGPLYLATVALGLAGLAVPAGATRLGRLVRWARRLRSYRRLFPLWHALYRADPDIALVRPSRWRVRRLGFHLYRRVIEIRDGQLALRSYADPAAGVLARTLGSAAGMTGDLLDATVEAAEIAVSLDAKAAGRVPAARAQPSDVDGPGADRVDPADLDAEIGHLEAVARQLASPVVQAVRSNAASAFATSGAVRRIL